ncbi:sugar ABC transporter permease [Cellulomonas sp. NTE-D12]|uniref:carbohydrate ABC transporter permease n=1 Tax=Cellulomonas sp. NTE-D12 TaxID=2962632 RepID=UPI003081365E|nr:sugar ABC transporter permease [Cellulomonas sp. NTE-D12]
MPTTQATTPRKRLGSVTAEVVEAGTPERRSSSANREERRTAYLMLAPMVVLLGIFVVWPLVYAFKQSMYQGNFYKAPVFVGLSFYKYVLTDPGFYQSLKVGGYYAVIVVPGGMLIALLLASFIKTLGARMASFMKTTVYLPTVVSAVIASVLFRLIYADQGLANWLLGVVNLGPKNFLGNASMVIPAVAVPGIWLGLGITTLIMLAGLLDIPESYLESAQLDGAGFLQRTWYITLPLLKNVLLYLFVTGLVAAFQEFLLPLLIANGGPVNASTTPNLYIFNQFRSATPYAMTFSITASLVLFIVLGTISALVFRLIKSEKAVDA